MEIKKTTECLDDLAAEFVTLEKFYEKITFVEVTDNKKSEKLLKSLMNELSSMGIPAYVRHE